jgi:hypothetical protein
VALAALGRVWTSTFIAGFKDTTVVRSGPYSALRHPLYALSMLAMLGVGLATRSLSITLALVAIFATLYLRAAREEDAYLAREHGPAHAGFAATTPAFWPDLDAYRVPESIEVRPRVFWKAFLDAGSLLGLYVLACVADVLQRSGVTPTLLSLP